MRYFVLFSSSSSFYYAFKAYQRTIVWIERILISPKELILQKLHRFPLLSFQSKFPSFLKKDRGKKKGHEITQPRKQKKGGSRKSIIHPDVLVHTTSVPVEGKESRVNTRECKDPLRRREAFIREFIIKGLLKIVLQARSPLAIHGKKERKAPLSFDPPSALLFAFWLPPSPHHLRS